MEEIRLDNFILIKIDRTNDTHNRFIKEIDMDSDIKKYLYPYNDSLDDYLDTKVSGEDIFNNTYIVYYDNNIIGYIEIESFKIVKLNYAILRSFRGLNLGSLLIKEITDYIMNNYSNVDSVNTIIRNENVASIKASIKSGLDYIEEKDGFTTYGRTR